MGLRLSTLVFCRDEIDRTVSWGVSAQTDQHLGDLTCPRGATLCPLSMIEGTDLPLWAI